LESMVNVSALVNEYSTLFGVASTGSTESFEDILVSAGDCSPKAASHLLQLARQYGSFMLRNALAISLALEIEDGDLGF
jgi:hypothetical protein